ncbi:hypothetical protein [Gordonia spumicola]|uniref:hypothetical protein n=1 Tax=Gordonia spumicola TaxID=589161 RepID=UPI00225E20A1|nr:hypothetical protein [Gordonia spumicola]
MITFQPKSGDPSVTTHRIISIVYDASGTRRFITKGDANNSTDPVQLVEEQIRGRLIYSIPKLGYLNNVMSGNSRSIAVFLIAGALGLYALWMWIGSIRDRKKPKDGDPEPTDKADAPPPGPESGETSSSEWPAADPGTLGSLVVTAAPATDVVATPAVVAPQPDPYEYASAPSPAPTPVQPLGGHAGSPSARMFPAQQMAVPHAYSPSPCHVCGAPAPPPAEPLADVPSTATTRPIPIIK